MKPKIRLKGFSGEWEYKKLSSLTSVRGGYAFQSSLFQKSGIPVVRISNILSNGSVGGDFAYYPKLDGDSNVTLHDKDVVIAMSGATTGKIARVDIGDGVLYQNQRVGLFTKTGKVDYDFLYAVLNRPHFNELLNKLLTSSAQPNASSADIESIEMGFPLDAEEQKALSNYILSLDSLIQSTTKKIESLKQVKAASLQSMFPQEGETKPRVRFKGFEGEWEKVTLGDCLIINNERNQNNAYGINDVLSVSDEEGVVNQIKLLGRSYAGKSVSNYRVLKTNQIVYTKSPLKSKPYGIVKVNKGSVGIVSVLYAVYDTKENVCPDYIHYYFEPTHRINNYLLPLINKGAKNTMNISDEMALTGSIWIPSYKEQEKIAEYMQSLDSQISLQTLRLEKLKQIKSACLDNMFV